MNEPRQRRRTALGPALLAGLWLAAAPASAAWRLDASQTLTRSGTAVSPVVSGDAKRVAYLVGTRNAGAGTVSGRVWALDLDAKKAQRLGRFNVALPAGEHVAAFDPDGGAYAMVEGSAATPNLWYVGPEGSRLRVGDGRAPAFDARGDFLAYLVVDRTDKPALELWLFDTERRESKRLTRVVLAEAPAALAAPRWTRDNARILFLADGDIHAYGRFTGRIEPVTRTGDVAGFDVAGNGGLWFLRAGGSRETAGIWRQRPDGKTTMRAFRADELPPGIASLTAGPDPDCVLFLAETALGRGLVAADVRDGRWRLLAAAEAFALQPGGRNIAVETESDGQRNIALGRLAWSASGSGN